MLDSLSFAIPTASPSAIRRDREVERARYVAMADAYPATRHLLGDRVFALAAWNYIDRRPAARLGVEFGAGFADGLAATPGIAGSTALVDLARLEWAVKAVRLAADPPPLGLHAFETTPAATLPELRVVLHPARRVVASRYPIDRLWRLHRPQGGFDAAAEAGPVTLAIERIERLVVVRRIEAAEFAFRRHLGGGNTIFAAAEAARSAGPFEWRVSLAALARSGGIVGFLGPVGRA